MPANCATTKPPRSRSSMRSPPQSPSTRQLLSRPSLSHPRSFRCPSRTNPTAGPSSRSTACVRSFSPLRDSSSSKRATPNPHGCWRILRAMMIRPMWISTSKRTRSCGRTLTTARASSSSSSSCRSRTRLSARSSRPAAAAAAAAATPDSMAPTKSPGLMPFCSVDKYNPVRFLKT